MMKKVIQITITERCNLNCVYCYENDRNTNIMSIDLAKEIIIKSFNEYSNIDFLEFDFHGGEIALAFDFIKELCEWTWSNKWNVPYIFHATTNGTLIHGDILNWFSSNAKRFSLGLSLDGNKYMHDLNRSCSYDLIDLDFFARTYPYQPIKMTISPQTLPYLCNGVIDIYSKGFLLSANLAYGMEWDDNKLKAIYQSQLLELANWHLENPNNDLTSLIVDRGLSRLGYYIHHNQMQLHHKWCGTGENMCCYSVDGDKLPCQMFNSSSNTHYCKELLSQNNWIDIQVSDECKNCPILSICPSCYGTNYIKTQKIIKCADNLCEYRKIEALASSYFYGKAIMSNIKHKAIKEYTSMQKAYMAIAINYIQKTLL